MNRFVTPIALCLVAIVATAQQKADIEVSYLAAKQNFRTGKPEGANQYVLLANDHASKFYSPRTEYIDSLRSTPAGEAKYKEMTRNAYLGDKLDEMPRRDGSYYVFKSSPDNAMLTYDVNGIEKFIMEESVPQPEWILADSTKNILGYECQMATAHFHGRNWSVWFTPEIPIMDGPWKLGGLPGLILEAVDETGLYSFTATGIRQTSRIMVPIYLPQDFEKIDRKEFLKAKRRFMDNPMQQINVQLAGSGISIGGSGNEFRYQPREVIDFIETDY